MLLSFRTSWGSEAASHSALRLSLIMAGCTSSGTLYSEAISF
ncbi:hypothetical protein [Paenibacillus mucilaginosus]|nr:hypothetical protein [Paenibacillus mucilaginosus]